MLCDEPPPLDSGDPFRWFVYADFLFDAGDPRGAYAKCVADTLEAFEKHRADARRLLLLRSRPPGGSGSRSRWSVYRPRPSPLELVQTSPPNNDDVLWVNPKGAGRHYRVGILDEDLTKECFTPWEIEKFAEAAPKAVWAYLRRITGDAQYKGWVKYDTSWVGKT